MTTRRGRSIARSTVSLVDALAATAGNQSAAARRLGIARATLIKRIEQFGLARPKKS